jgi:hypothetical protein
MTLSASSGKAGAEDNPNLSFIRSSTRSKRATIDYFDHPLLMVTQPMQKCIERTCRLLTQPRKHATKLLNREDKLRRTKLRTVMQVSIFSHNLIVPFLKKKQPCLPPTLNPRPSSVLNWNHQLVCHRGSPAPAGTTGLGSSFSCFRSSSCRFAHFRIRFTVVPK